MPMDLSLPLTNPAQVFVVLFLIVLLAPMLAQRVRIPSIIGLILAGLAVGPNTSGLLVTDGLIEMLGGAGLLYLMFLGGLDLDLDEFHEHRRDSVVFGVTTFLIPMVVNTAVALALGLEPFAALLIASAFTSHTLLTYPLVQRFGLIRNRSVTATLGATLLATTAALLVLGIVAALSQGEAGPEVWLRLAAALAALGVLTVWGVPRLTRWFFAGLGQDRTVRFTFVLAVLFGLAALADLTGIEAIVGAFLAGLALNRFVPEGSVLAERVRFLGSILLIPVFLVWTGMLIDPVALVAEPRGLVLGLALTVAALASKWLAAWPAARLLGFDRAELGLAFSLTSAQAAGALAAAIVANQLGLIGSTEINAVVLVILITCLVAPAIGARYAPQVRRPEPKAQTLGRTVVVPIANPESAVPLVRIAGLVAGPEQGAVVPVNVLGFDAPDSVIAEHREIAAEAERLALASGAEAHGMVRVDASPSAGVLHTVVETSATSLLVGWKGYANARENLFGGVIDTILSRVRVPVMVCRPGVDETVGRVILSVTGDDLAPAGRPALVLACEVAGRIARRADVPLLVVTEQEEPGLYDLVDQVRKVTVVVDERKPAIVLREHAVVGDVIVLGTPPTRAGLSQHALRAARAVPERTVIVTVPRTGT